MIMETPESITIQFTKGDEVTLQHIGQISDKEIYSETKYSYDLDSNIKETLRITIDREKLSDGERRIALFNKMMKGVTVRHSEIKNDEDGTN